MSCVICQENKAIVSHCVCGGNICESCAEKKIVELEWTDFDSKCNSCNRYVCYNCSVFCYDCANSSNEFKTYCSYCENNVIPIGCEYHKWSTCPAEHEFSYGECGECVANRNYARYG